MRTRTGRGHTRRQGIAFYGYLSGLLSLLIAMAVVIWLIYWYLPGEDYLPLSLGSLAVFGIVAYLILSRRVITNVEGLNRIFSRFTGQVS
jgi:hypothetical protein